MSCLGICRSAPFDVRQVTVEAVEVHSIAHDVVFGDLEPEIVDAGLVGRVFFLQKGTKLDRGRPLALEMRQEELNGLAAVYNVLKDQHMLSGNRLGEIKLQSQVARLAFAGVAGDPEKITAQGKLHVSDEIRHEDRRALQDADDD